MICTDIAAGGAEILRIKQTSERTQNFLLAGISGAAKFKIFVEVSKQGWRVFFFFLSVTGCFLEGRVEIKKDTELPYILGLSSLLRG